MVGDCFCPPGALTPQLLQRRSLGFAEGGEDTEVRAAGVRPGRLVGPHVPDGRVGEVEGQSDVAPTGRGCVGVSHGRPPPSARLPWGGLRTRSHGLPC